MYTTTYGGIYRPILHSARGKRSYNDVVMNYFGHPYVNFIYYCPFFAKTCPTKTKSDSTALALFSKYAKVS